MKLKQILSTALLLALALPGQAQHKTILYSSHDLDLLLRHSDHMWVMAPHQALRQGTPKELVEQGIIDDYFKPIVAKEEFFWMK